MAATWSSLGEFCPPGAGLCQSPTPAEMLQTSQTCSTPALNTPPSPLCFLLSSANGALPHLHRGIAMEHQLICTALHSSAPPGGLRAHHQLLLFCCKGKAVAKVQSLSAHTFQSRATRVLYFSLSTWMSQCCSTRSHSSGSPWHQAWAKNDTGTRVES